VCSGFIGSAYTETGLLKMNERHLLEKPEKVLGQVKKKVGRTGLAVECIIWRRYLR
jgi:hypothetical protein